MQRAGEFQMYVFWDEPFLSFGSFRRMETDTVEVRDGAEHNLQLEQAWEGRVVVPQAHVIPVHGLHHCSRQQWRRHATMADLDWAPRDHLGHGPTNNVVSVDEATPL